MEIPVFYRTCKYLCDRSIWISNGNLSGQILLFLRFLPGMPYKLQLPQLCLTDLYGENFAFTDSAHVGRPRDEIRNTDFKARHFNSFWQVAEETANSRFYGGIHTPQDNATWIGERKRLLPIILTSYTGKNKT